MDHPPITDLLDATPTPATAAHLATCADCRALAGLGDPFADALLPELVEVDPELYGRRTPLREAHAGMGIALRARDRRLGREVVIKQARSPALRARFEREARVTARLQHPGIVGVLELGKWPDGEPFYTMPLVEGAPLDEAIGAASTVEARIALVPRLAAAIDAVAFAHDRGVVHRDLKPENILLGAFGETVVIDWGLATPAGEAAEAFAGALPEARDGLTRAGAGTPPYMAPEQARGARPDPRADVYALGATLYHVLAGAPPYAGDAARQQLLEGPPPALETRAPGAPRELVAICARAMARDPAARFARAGELAEELRRYTTGQLIRSHPYSAAELVARWLRRHKLLATVIAAAVVLGAIAIARIVGERARAQEAQRSAERSLAVARAAQAKLAAADPTRRVDAAALALQVLAAAPSPPAEVWQDLVDALAAGPAARPLSGQATMRNLAAAPGGERFATFGSGVVTIFSRTGVPEGALASPALHGRWAPGGEQLAAIGDGVDVWRADGPSWRVPGAIHATFTRNGELVTVDAAGALRRWAGGAEVASAAAGCRPTSIAAADDRVAVGCDDGALVVWTAADLVRSAAHPRLTHVRALEGGDAIISYGGDPSVRVWRAGGEPTLVTTREPHVIDALPVPGGRAVLTVDGGELWAFDASTGARVRELWFDPQRSPIAADAPLVYGPQGHDVILGVHAATLEPVIRLHGHRRFDRAEVAALADAVATVTSSGEAWLWDARLGAAAGALAAHEAEIVGVATDGVTAIVASVDGLVRASRLADGAVLATTRVGSEAIEAEVTPEGLLTGHADGTARTWDLRGALVSTVARPLPASAPPIDPDRGITAVAVTPDGRWRITGHVDGAVRVHPMIPETAVERACGVLTAFGLGCRP